jgi:EcsC protein family
MSLSQRLGQTFAPKITELAPTITGGFVHHALDRAIRGVGPLDSAAVAAQKQLDEQKGDREKAVREVIENNVRLAGVQGFLTNIGGLVTMTVTVPVNITGLALIQCRMVAGVAHLRGYDLADRRTRDAILLCLLGEERILSLLGKKRVPATPMALATAPVHDPHLDIIIANEVAAELIAKVAGKRIATTVGRRIPIVGGLVGAGVDGLSTWQIGRYVERELLPRKRR